MGLFRKAVSPSLLDEYMFRWNKVTAQSLTPSPGDE